MHTCDIRYIRTCTPTHAPNTKHGDACVQASATPNIAIKKISAREHSQSTRNRIDATDAIAIDTRARCQQQSRCVVIVRCGAVLLLVHYCERRARIARARTLTRGIIEWLNCFCIRCSRLRVPIKSGGSANREGLRGHAK